MEPDNLERRLQQGYLNGQEVLKALWRRRLKLLGGAIVKAVGAAWRGVRP